MMLDCLYLSMIEILTFLGLALGLVMPIIFMPLPGLFSL